MTISVREQAIFVEVEATPGTAETLVGADAVQVSNLQVNFAEDLRMIDRTIIRSSLNPAKSVYGGALIGFSFDVELKGSGTAGVAPRLGDLLRACAMDETVVTDTSVTYNPLSDLSAHETVTIGYREGGNYRIAEGCRGTFTMTAEGGQPARLTFNLKGRIVSETAASAPTPSEEATLPPPFVNASVAIGGFSAEIQSITLDVGNNVIAPVNPNNADGFGDVRITARNSRGTINPKREAIGTKDYVGIFRAGTNQAIATGVIGGTAGNRWALSVPVASFVNVGGADRDELLTYDLEFQAVDTDGTNDFAIAFT